VSELTNAPTSTAAALAFVARLLGRAGLVEGFGHVSARSDDGFLITSTRPLGGARAEEVIAVRGDDAPAEGAPLETPLHAAIYDARADVSAICRTHSRFAVAWGARREVPPLVHGLGALAGSVTVSDDVQLVADPDRADRVAAELGERDCLLLRGNGALATARTLESAAVRAWFLEERCRVAADSGGGLALTEAELAERSSWFPAEEARAWRWLQWRFGENPRPE
jgi:HCOMODA/2-hydroxy-3-carboxy-muconic semialdehyde decarboxylase